MFKSLRKSAIRRSIEKSITNQDKTLLHSSLIEAYRLGIDKSNKSLIAQLLTETWHDEHEDLIDTISSEYQKDDIFTDALYKVATEPDVYRKYDDELESTLRKCVHALKIINTEKANGYLENLKKTHNSNVNMVLSMYNK